MFLILLLCFGIFIIVGMVYGIYCIIKLPAEKRKIALGIVGILVLVLAGYGTYRYFSMERNGFVGIETVQVGDVKYRYAAYDLTGEGRTIGKIDDWRIKEVPEDPSHTFLVVRSFLDQDYIVREDYTIPEHGEVSCVYINRERSTDESLLQTMTEIMNTEFEDGFEIKVSNHHIQGVRGIADKLLSVSLGYEGCPVGTDYSIYRMGQLEDGRWVVVFRSDKGEVDDDGNYMIRCYELSKKHQQVLEKCGLWD